VPQAQDTGKKVANSSRIELISTSTMAGDLESCVRTIRRLALADPDFPKITRIGNRDFVRSDDWESYKACLVQRGLKTRAPVPA
jgi:hypothetical protein